MVTDKSQWRYDAKKKRPFFIGQAPWLLRLVYNLYAWNNHNYSNVSGHEHFWIEKANRLQFVYRLTRDLLWFLFQVMCITFIVVFGSLTVIIGNLLGICRPSGWALPIDMILNQTVHRIRLRGFSFQLWQFLIPLYISLALGLFWQLNYFLAILVFIALATVSWVLTKLLSAPVVVTATQ